MKRNDRPLILASRLHPTLQLKVQSGFWLVLPEKSDAGFPIVNPAYGDKRSHWGRKSPCYPTRLRLYEQICTKLTHMPETNSEMVKHSISALNLYETDFYAWTQEQAMFLRNQQWSQIDMPNLIEEIESLGKQQRQELRNYLSVLVGHLLKWHYQPQYRSRSWLATLRNELPLAGSA